MDPLSLILLETLFGTLIGLVIKGVKWIINIKPEARKKLKAVYLEVNANKTLLEKTAGKDGKGVMFGTKEFKDLAAGLSNTASKPLYKEYKTVRRSRIVTGGKYREQINRLQYAVNYTVRQIDELKALSKQKNAAKLRLSIRLKTLIKHLGELEKVLVKIK